MKLRVIFETQISKILPGRYDVQKAIVCDREGRTSGEHDIVIFNDHWFPNLTGKNPIQKRSYLPIEGVYAIGEVKQTLNFDTLDAGVRKLVIAQRLNRPKIGWNRYTENRKFGDSDMGCSNPLFTFLIAVNHEENISMEDIYDRFFEINKSLNRQEMVRGLCVLNEYYFSWVTFNDLTKEFDVIKFDGEDENSQLRLGLKLGKGKDESCFNSLIMHLGGHLNNSILGSEDIFVAYGNDNHRIRVPAKGYTIPKK